MASEALDTNGDRLRAHTVLLVEVSLLKLFSLIREDEQIRFGEKYRLRFRKYPDKFAASRSEKNRLGFANLFRGTC